MLVSISPSVVDCGGGALLSVYGTGVLSDIRRCEPVVQIGDVIVQAVCVSPREIRCTAPPSARRLQHIAISFNDGVTFHGPKKRTGSSQTSEAVTVRSVALAHYGDRTAAYCRWQCGSVVQVEVRTTLLKHHDALHVQFRGDNDQIQTVDATVASADKEKNVVVVACTTPRMLSACTASMHISVNGQEYSDTCSSRSIFHTPALAESTCPRHVPTFGGTNVRLLLVRPVQGIDPSSLHLVRCMVKLVATSDSKTTQEHLVEATLNSQNLGEIRFVAPPWPVADEVAVYVTLNGGDDWANSGGSIVCTSFSPPSSAISIPPSGPRAAARKSTSTPKAGRWRRTRSWCSFTFFEDIHDVGHSTAHERRDARRSSALVVPRITARAHGQTDESGVGARPFRPREDKMQAAAAQPQSHDGGPGDSCPQRHRLYRARPAPSVRAVGTHDDLLPQPSAHATVA